MAPGAPRRPRAPKGARWLTTLVDDLRRGGVEIRAAGALGGVLKLTLAEPGGLVVEVKPREAGRRYFQETARFGIAYCGAGRLTPAQEELLGRLCAVLARVEAQLPEVLADRVGVGTAASRTTDAEPEHSLERARSAADGSRSCELLVRLTSRCNQDCAFCSAPPPHAEPTLAGVLAFLGRILPTLPDPLVTLTGGEPTIWPELRALVRDLLDRPGGPRVRLQTNAVAFAELKSLAGWPRSDRLSFFVSFHAAEGPIYDQVTATSGQFERAVKGIRNLVATGSPVVVNLVATRHNFEHILDWVRAVPRLFPAPDTPTIHFSIAMCPEHRPGAPDCLVRYSELAPRLQAAAALARELGVGCEPLLSSSHAAIPPCVLDEEYRVRGGPGAGGALPEQRWDEVGVEDPRKPWIKSRACARCVQDRLCIGLPRPYVARFGLDELRPIEAP